MKNRLQHRCYPVKSSNDCFCALQDSLQVYTLNMMYICLYITGLFNTGQYIQGYRNLIVPISWKKVHPFVEKFDMLYGKAAPEYNISNFSSKEWTLFMK